MKHFSAKYKTNLQRFATHGKFSSVQSACEASNSMLLTALSMILVTVFIYLYSIANTYVIDINRTKEVLTSIKETFPTALRTTKTELTVSTKQKDLYSSVIEQAKIDLDLVTKKTGFEIKKNGDTIVISGLQGLVFTYDNRISPEALPILEKIAQVAELYKLHVKSTSIPGAFPSDATVNYNSANMNWDKALEQASTIYRLFIDLNISPTKLFCIGKLPLDKHYTPSELIIELSISGKD